MIYKVVFVDLDVIEDMDMLFVVEVLIIKIFKDFDFFYKYGFFKNKFNYICFLL